MGSEVLMRHYVTAIELEDGRAVAVRAPRRRRAATASSATTSIITMPMRIAGARRSSRAARPRAQAAEGSRYRDFLVVRAHARPRATCSPTTGSTSTPGRQGRPHPELQQLEPGDGPGAGHDLPRHGVLLLRGRRALGELATPI